MSWQMRHQKKVLKPNWVHSIIFIKAKLIVSPVEYLSEDLNAPIYVFFRKVPWVEYVNDCWVHVFECAAGKCRGKNRQDVHQFLDTGDAKSTSGLCRHAENCWGDEAVAAVDSTQDLVGARVVLAKMKLCDGSITAKFECIWKKKSKLFTLSAYFNRSLVRWCVFIDLVNFHLILYTSRAEIVCWVAESKWPFKILADHDFHSLMKTGQPEHHHKLPLMMSEMSLSMLNKN